MINPSHFLGLGISAALMVRENRLMTLLDVELMWFVFCLFIYLFLVNEGCILFLFDGLLISDMNIDTEKIGRAKYVKKKSGGKGDESRGQIHRQIERYKRERERERVKQVCQRRENRKKERKKK